MAPYDDLDEELSDDIVSFAVGDISSRDGLTQQEKTMVTVSTPVALGTEPQLKRNMHTGFDVGLTKGRSSLP